jgi:hypothetical protein
MRTRERMALIDYANYCQLVADAYEAAPLLDPDAIPAWEALAKHTEKMFDQMLSKVEVEFVDYDPYSSADEMRQDVDATGVLKVSTLHSEHPFFTLEQNVKFRAVHDWMIHLATEKDFSRRGELGSYNAHARLLPPKAWPALFTEVVGQVCYQTVTGDFPVQKVAFLPGFDYKDVGKVTGYEIEDKVLKAAERRLEHPERFRFEVAESDPKDTVGRSKGYVIHTISAFDTLDPQAEKPAGYLKIAHVPAEFADELFPTIWHFAKAHRGWYLNLEDPEQLWRDAYRHVYYVGDAPEPPKDIDLALGKLAERARLNQEYEEWYKNVADRPFVDYIRVEEPYQRQGLGAELYIKAAQWLADQYDLPLRSSTLQSEDAKAAWKAMQNAGLPIKKTRAWGKPAYLLDYT